MPGFSIQFHALLHEELLPLMSSAVSEFSLHVTAKRFPPQVYLPVEPGKMADVLRDPKVETLMFTLKPPQRTTVNAMNFLADNPDALVLDIGTQSKDGLKESHLSTMVTLASWQQIAKRVRNMTRTGGVALDRKGIGHPLKGHRFTEGARALEATGVPMITITGVVLRFNEA